ncbi:hypothetical protein BKI52_38160 [marine bacterium AO1-C]|nr:hypothetical protein BKI52_38160 [marine bacterium AO1-C]
MGVLVVMTQCNQRNNDPQGTASADWQINPTDVTEATNATGEITNQNNGPLVKYQVASSLIYKGEGNLHIFKLRFTTQDSLTCYIEKKTQDFNYHSDAASDQNKLHMVVFNLDTLQLKPSAISIQPRQDENKFHTVSNIHSQAKGDFNGTVNGVPLIQ